jgi:hypothetical protein
MSADQSTRHGPTRWQFDLASGLQISAAARGWLDLPAFSGPDWKRVVLTRLATSDRTRLVAALLAGLDGVAIDVQTATADRDSPRLLRWIAAASLDGCSLDGMLLDISRDTRERDALLELAGLQRSFIDALPWPACAYDEAGDVLLGNRLWRRCADCTLELGGEEVPLPQLPEWLCQHRGDFAGGSAGERHLAVILRQGGTPLNVLSVESRPLPLPEQPDQDEAASRGR